jgi:hypothetical protein
MECAEINTITLIGRVLSRKLFLCMHNRIGQFWRSRRDAGSLGFEVHRISRGAAPHRETSHRMPGRQACMRPAAGLPGFS